MRSSTLVAILACLISTVCLAKEPDELLTSPTGRAFGSAPAMWGLSISPNGSQISFLQKHPRGMTIGRTIDLGTGASAIIVAGDTERLDVNWCEWASDTRLLCGLRAPVIDAGFVYPVTRLIAVNSDGSDQLVLLARRLDNENAQIQDRVLDWLPDDPEHVLVQEPGDRGSGVARLNIYDGDLDTTERSRAQVYRWISDGSGEARIFRRTSEFNHTWYARDPGSDDWKQFYESPISAIEDTFVPIGFGADPNELLYYDLFEGRQTLFGLNLQTADTRLIYGHDTYDVAVRAGLGKRRRLVAAIHVDDRPRAHFFDRRIEYVQELVEAQFPDKLINIVDEDWNQRFYLVYISGDNDPGAYYRVDANNLTFAKLADAFPALASQQLANMTEVFYTAADGVDIPAYLTLPGNEAAQPHAAVVLPHGGPSSRDYWSYDFLAQFFAAHGYAVLQSNYRGSSGYGANWEGEGAFRGWRQAVADIRDGAKFLIDSDIANAEKICIVGWSYGGYAALMSVIEDPELYQCAASIAGVTDPFTLGTEMRNFVGGRATQLFIGLDNEVVEAGSPLRRADEISVPLMLFHAERDINVPFDQSDDLAKALRRARADFEFIEYEFAEHDIEPERYRIDMLTRLGDFLARHLGDD